MFKPTLGVMTLVSKSNKFHEEIRFFRKLSIQGDQLGIQIAVFTPVQAKPGEKIPALMYQINTKKWERKWIPFPPLVYDRVRYSMQNPGRFKDYLKFKKKYKDDIDFLNHRLANKWNVHRVLFADPDIRRYLPETIKYSQFIDLKTALQRSPVWFLKPMNGTGGRGILRIQQFSSKKYGIQGRNKYRKIIKPRLLSPAQLTALTHRWNMSNKYVLQKGLDLYLANGKVHDYRLLIQKNARGEWAFTGGAGRIGAKSSITANLHGGGKAVPMESLLKLQFNEARVQSITNEMERLCHLVVNQIERNYGRMCELALDVAVDSDGHVWLLEINQKPSREVFSQIDEPGTYLASINRPLEYALTLLQNRESQRD